jgi:pimeloyl-ACP methyl ester carboxylesterase
MSRNGNGSAAPDLHWTERLHAEPAPLPELPDHPTPLELARSYGSLAMAYASQHPVVVEALHDVHGVGLGNRAILERIEKTLWNRAPGIAPPLPPMRDPLDTQSFVVGAKSELASAVAQLASESPGPLVEAPPERIVSLYEAKLDQWAAKREQAREFQRLRDQEEAAKKKRELDASDRRAILRTVVGGILLAVALSVGGYLFGHAKGLVERDMAHEGAAPANH